MKKLGWSLVLVLSLALGAGAVFARPGSNRVTANVPFDFYVGKTALPAGPYEVYQPVDTALDLVIRNTETGKSILVPVMSGVETMDMGKPELLFKKVDDKCYLWEILPRWSEGYELGGIRMKHHAASFAGLPTTSVAGE